MQSSLFTKSRHSLGNELGYSLTEVLISAGLAVLVCLMAGSLIIGSTTISAKTIENIKTQSDMSFAIYELRSLARRAIDVRYADNVALEGKGSTVSEGYVRYYSYRNFGEPAVSPADTNVLMFFNRDEAKSGGGTVRSLPIPTAVFFTKPTNDATKSGQIKVISGAAGVSGNLMPGSNGIMFDGITSVMLVDPQVSQNSKVIQSITLRLVARYFMANEALLPKKYCPPDANAAVCQGGAPYRDVEREVILQFDNNLREVQHPVFEFSAGTYFFRPTQGNQTSSFFRGL